MAEPLIGPSTPVARPSGLPIEEEDWEATPRAVQRLLVVLWEELQQLREQVQQNSRNSSRPPSSDPPGTARRGQKPSGRRPGGQEGHTGVGWCLKPPEELKAVIAAKPEACVRCGRRFEESQGDPSPRRHQVTEIPPVVAETTEYQLHRLQCPGWGTAAELPEGVPHGAFGPRVQAMVAALSGQYPLSKRPTEGMCEDFFGLELGLGTVSSLEQSMSEALAQPLAEALAWVQESSMANMDVTGWRQGNGKQKAWLWTVVTGGVTVFLIRLSRGGQVAKELLGEAFGGIVGSDRWSGYNWLCPERRQLCWAHLLRDFAALLERGGVSQKIGEGLLQAADRMFDWWYRVRDGTLSREEFAARMHPLQMQVGEWLRAGASCDHKKTAATCAKVLQLEVALWTFVRIEGVEPTNNAAERSVRPGVLWRKGSFGTQSEPGSRFVERIMTVVATCKQQRRNVLEYLTEAAEAALRGQNAPSLLPSPPAVH